MSVTEDKKGSILPSLEQQPSGWGRNKELKAGLGPPSFPSSPTAAVPRAGEPSPSRGKLQEHAGCSPATHGHWAHTASPEPAGNNIPEALLGWMVAHPHQLLPPAALPHSCPACSNSLLEAGVSHRCPGLAIIANWPAHVQAA